MVEFKKLRDVPLGMDGLAYVKSCLEQGAGLCAKIRELGLDNGIAFAPVPEGTTPERTKDFETGGLIESQMSSLVWLDEHLRKNWSSGSAGTVVFQDIWAKVSDPEVQRSNTKKFFNQGNVYYFLEPAELNMPAVLKAFRSPHSFLAVAFYSHATVRASQLPTDLIVDGRLIDQFAQGIQEVFVGAYDQEGWVVWCRSHENWRRGGAPGNRPTTRRSVPAS